METKLYRKISKIKESELNHEFIITELRNCITVKTIKDALRIPEISFFHPGQKIQITLETAEFLTKNFSTGKSFRDLQMWTNYMEISINNTLFQVQIPDNSNICYLISGSDLN